MIKDINGFGGIMEANKKLGVLGYSPRIFEYLEECDDYFLEDVLNALVRFTMIEGDNINKFARFNTCEGYICIYSCKGQDEKGKGLFTNIMFADEKPLNY